MGKSDLIHFMSKTVEARYSRSTLEQHIHTTPIVYITFSFSHHMYFAYPSILRTPAPRSNVKGRGLRLGNVRSVRLERRSHLSRGEFLHLLRGAADESAGVEKTVQFGEDGVEEGGAADSLE